MTFSVIILAAGYGTRLQSDVAQLGQVDSEWQYLLNCPKSLIRLAGIPLLTRWMTDLESLSDKIKTICVVTNDRYFSQLQKWRLQTLTDSKLAEKIVIFNNFTSSNEDRLGSVVDLFHGLNILQSDSDIKKNPVLIIAGDTIFSEEFSVSSLYKDFLGREPGVSMIIAAPCPEEEVSKHGIIELDTDDDPKVVSFLEKPQLSETISRIQSPCCYLLTFEAGQRVKSFLEEHPSKKDSIGSFIQYLLTDFPVFAFKVQQRFDLGNLKSCIEANKYFMQK